MEKGVEEITIMVRRLGYLKKHTKETDEERR